MINKLRPYWNLALGAGLIAFIPHASLADTASDPQNDVFLKCASAVNMTECMQQNQSSTTSQSADIKNLPINSQSFGMAGPFSAAVRYDSDLEWILDAGYSQAFFNNALAFGAKGSLGQNEYRGNLTTGVALSPQQQIKLTYEYLTQNLPFDFATGTVNEWVSQNAFGAAYRYLLKHKVFHSFEFTADYTQANSKELSTISIYNNGTLTDINERRIAGGTEKNAGGAITLLPLRNTLLKLGAGYSTLDYDTQWEDNQQNATIAYKAELSHILTPKTMLSTAVDNTASGRTHTARISQILPGDFEASFAGQYYAGQGEIGNSGSVLAGISYPAPKTYDNQLSDNLNVLKNWVESPVVYRTRVLAIKDERVIKVQMTTSPIPAQFVAVDSMLNPSLQTKDYFSFVAGSFQKVEYKLSAIHAIHPDGSTQSVTPAALQLQLAPIDNYHATLSSVKPMPASAQTPGRYLVNIEALAYRNGQVINKAQNSFELNIYATFTPSWVKDKTPPNATIQSPYSYPLNETIISNVNDDKVLAPYEKDSKSNCSWLSLNDKKDTLVGTPPTNAPAECNLTLNVKSQKTGQIRPISATIKVASFHPTWKTGQGPNDSQPTYENLFQHSLDNIQSNIPNDEIEYVGKGTVWDCQWLDVHNNSLLQGTPNSNASCKISIEVKSKKTGITAYVSDEIHIINHFTPSWITQPEFAYFNTVNNYPLNEMVKSNYNNDTLTYTIDKDFRDDNLPTCTWLTVKDNILTGTPPGNTPGKCKIKLVVNSSAAQTSSTELEAVTIETKTKATWGNYIVPTPAQYQGHYKFIIEPYMINSTDPIDSQYEIASKTCDWLNIAYNNGKSEIISDGRVPTVPTSCQISLKVFYTQKDQNGNVTRTGQYDNVAMPNITVGPNMYATHSWDEKEEGCSLSSSTIYEEKAVKDFSRCIKTRVDGEVVPDSYSGFGTPSKNSMYGTAALNGNDLTIVPYANDIDSNATVAIPVYSAVRGTSPSSYGTVTTSRITATPNNKLTTQWIPGCKGSNSDRPLNYDNGKIIVNTGSSDVNYTLLPNSCIGVYLDGELLTGDKAVPQSSVTYENIPTYASTETSGTLGLGFNPKVQDLGHIHEITFKTTSKAYEDVRRAKVTTNVKEYIIPHIAKNVNKIIYWLHTVVEGEKHSVKMEKTGYASAFVIKNIPSASYTLPSYTSGEAYLCQGENLNGQTITEPEDFGWENDYKTNRCVKITSNTTSLKLTGGTLTIIYLGADASWPGVSDVRISSVNP